MINKRAEAINHSLAAEAASAAHVPDPNPPEPISEASLLNYSEYFLEMC
jgi:hypothetical protein